VSELQAQQPISIHDYPHRMERALRHLRSQRGICEANKRTLLAYMAHLEDEGLSLARRVTHLVRLTRIAEVLGKEFASATETDIRQLMRSLKMRKTRNGKHEASRSELSSRSLEDYQNTIKKFWRWLKALPQTPIDPSSNPPETAWMRKVRVERNRLPEDFLTVEEKDRMLTAAEHPRDRAYLEVNWDSGARPGEILSRRLRDVEFDEYGAVMIVRHGKTGDRRIRLIESAPALATWVNNHPHRGDPDAPLWVNIGTTNHNESWGYYAARKLVRTLAEKAAIIKHVTPYSFRHGRATQLANHLTESQLSQHLGWRQGSKMPAVYVHLSGRDLDSRLLELHGLKPKTNHDLSEAVRTCPRCNTRNGPESKYCNRCGLTLDLKTALEAQERIDRAEDILEKLLGNAEVRKFLAAKIREMHLTEDLTA